MNMLQRLLTRSERASSEAARRARMTVHGEDPRATWRDRIVVGVGAALAGAGLAWLMDPQRGRSRRARLTDQAAAAVRRGARGAGRLANRVRSDVTGKLAAVRRGGENGDPFPDDVTLASRVQTELFRDPAVPKGALNVNVERGIVVLRGEVPDDAMRGALVSTVEQIPGVWAVRNLLRLPGEEASAESSPVST
jgi:osmotically-inducible protein OsmY